MPRQQGVMSAYQLTVHNHESNNQGGLVEYLEARDVNGDVVFIPAGTGRVRFGTHAVIVAEVLTGFVIIKDALGNSRKIAVVS